MGQYKQNKSKKATRSTKACSRNHQQQNALRSYQRAFQVTKNILNIYKLNILSVAVFIYQIRNKTAPSTFSGSFEKISHGYPTNISQFNYKTPKTALSKSKFRISFRGPSIWNNFLQNSKKETESLPLFKSKLKLKLLSFSNEITYF